MTEQQNYQPPTAPDSQQVPLTQVLGILWRGRWIILICTMLAIGAGIYHVQQRGTIYRATARLYVTNQNLNVIGGQSMFLGGADRNYANTQAEVLRSGPILARALNRPTVRDAAIFKSTRGRLPWLKRALQVSVGKKDDIITISLDSQLRDDACELVNQTVESYKEYLSEENKDTRDVLVAQLLEAKREDEKKLADLEEKVADLLDKSAAGGADSVAFATTRYADHFATLQRVRDKLRDIDLTLLSAKPFADEPALLLRALASGPASRAASNNRAADAIRARIDAFETQLTTLRRQATDKHPDAIDLLARKKASEQELARLESGLARTQMQFLEASRKELVAREKSLVAEIAKYESVVQAHRKETNQYKVLQRDIDETHASLKLFRDTMRNVSMNNDDKAAGMKIRWQEDASPETATVASNKSTTIALLGFLGLLLGAGLAWLRGMFDHRIRTVEDISQRVGLPVIGVTPRANLSKGITALAAWKSSRQLAEAARSLRTAVYYAMSAEDDRVLHVTSPDPGDGKSLTTACLGIAMAQAGQKTLLIDADLRKPRQDQLFEVENDCGLSDALTKPQARIAIVATGQAGLDILPSGPLPDNPAELLSSPQFEKLLATLAEKYDRILVDSPPALPVADARILGEKCDFTLLVTRVDKSTIKRTTLASDDLQALGAKILGAVINDMPKKIGYGYGYGYGYGGSGYGYGYGSYGGPANGQPKRAPKRIDAPTARTRVRPSSKVEGV